ncbi:hypothetical protein [uncultured Sphingomonas sp.]|uniref:hypothetical protein n=1 Tax=uncultured Sphingomonas sp. TaxID=158754 RepID=UPI00260D475C|nr:hypothetical protein [uncultured Sphingomonas sp.]
MSAISDALAAIRQLILMQQRMDQLDGRITQLVADVDGLTDALSNMRDRVSRLEGIIEGAALAARQRRIEE